MGFAEWIKEHEEHEARMDHTYIGEPEEHFPVCEECGDEIGENRLLYDNYGDIYCMRCAHKIFGEELDRDLVGHSEDYMVEN
jgi:RNA polymerase-binding transcription factor DksA